MSLKFTSVLHLVSNYLCVTVRLLGDRNDFMCPCTVSALRKVFASFTFFVRHFI